MNRKEAILKVVKKHPNAIFVFCNGLTSRYAASILSLKGPYLYLIHAMGEALSVGVGLASSMKNDVVVVDGDANAAMGLAAWPQLKLFENIHYYILDNGISETTGGQPTLDFSYFDTKKVNRLKIDYDIPPYPPLPPSPSSIIHSFKRYLNEL